MLDLQTWPPPPPRVNRTAGRPYILVGAALILVGIVLAALAIANVRSLGGACGLGIIAGVAIGTGLLALLYAVARGRLRV